MNEEQLQAAIAELLPTIGSVPGQTSSFAEVITESIEPKHLTLDAVRMFMPTRQLKVGDVLRKRVRTGPLPVRTFVPGTEHLADQIFIKDIFAYQVDQLITKVRFPLWELQRGDIVTVNTLRKEMQSSLIDEFVSKCFRLLTTVWQPYTHTITGSHYIDAVSTGLTESVIDTAVEKVLEHAGGVRAIVGPRSKLYPIYEGMGVVEHQIDATVTALGIPNILEQWKRTGKISTYKGSPLVELPQIYRNSADNYDEKLIPEEYVLVIGEDAGEFIFYGDVSTQEFMNMQFEPPEYSLAMWRGYSMVVDAPQNIVVIKVA